MTRLSNSSVGQYWKYRLSYKAAATLSSDDPAAVKHELEKKYLCLYCRRNRTKTVFLAGNFACIV